MTNEEFIKELESIGYVELTYSNSFTPRTYYVWYKTPDSVCFHKNEIGKNGGMWNFRYTNSRFEHWDNISNRWVAVEEGIDLYSLLVLYKDVN